MPSSQFSLEPVSESSPRLTGYPRWLDNHRYYRADFPHLLKALQAAYGLRLLTKSRGV